MTLESETILKKTLAIDILDVRPRRLQALKRLETQNLPQSVLRDVGLLVGLDPETTTSLKALADGAEHTLFNPITGLMYEDRARHTILTRISEQVIRGTDEFAVLKTDLNNLKGLNDRYGEEEANIGIQTYDRVTRDSLIEVIQSSGRQIHFAVVNEWGGRSDAVKIILIGPDLYKFTRAYVDSRIASPISVELRALTTAQNQTVNLSGEWGFFVSTRENVRAFTTSENSDLQKAGDLYTIVSHPAETMMVSYKVRAEAELINKALMATTHKELSALWSEILSLGARIPAEVIGVMVDRMQKIEPTHD